MNLSYAYGYTNIRYEFDSVLRNTGEGNGQIFYQNIKTLSLEASNEGTRCMPMGAASNLRTAPVGASTANRGRCEGMRLRRGGLLRIPRENLSSSNHYPCDSTLRRFYDGELPETLIKRAVNDGFRGVAA